MEQTSLFDSSENNPNLDLLELEEDQKKIGDKHKVYKTSFIETDFMSTDDIFSGFDEIRAITFSYDLAFVEKIMKMFEYGEIVLGGRFMVNRDSKLHELTAEAYKLNELMILSETAVDCLRERKSLVEMMSKGDLYIRSPRCIIDHRKIYLLNSDDGRTRVVKGSANFTRGAFSGSQNETYEIDDSKEAYEAYLKDFQTAWILSDEIQEEVVGVEKTGDPEKDIPVIKKVKETQKAILLEEAKKDESYYEMVRYAINVDKAIKKNKALLANVKLDSKKGFIEIVPETIKKIKTNARSEKRKKLEIKEIVKDYPSLNINYGTKEAFMDEEKLDLHPTDDQIRNDIDVLFEALGNYEKDFIGNTNKATLNHYKLLNILFCSPFNAKIRCLADIKQIPTSSLPLFALLSSPGSNSGKTFMAELILKLMTNKLLKGYSMKQIPTKDIDLIQGQNKGLPIFIDEIDGKYYSRLKADIKNNNYCEILQRDNQPLLLFAQNQQKDPDEPERKRMPFLKYDINLKSDIDTSAYEAIGKSLKYKATNALFREYLRRMIDEVEGIIDYIIKAEDIPNNYYPDLINVSSKVLIDIFTELGYELPKYVRELTWNEDLSYRANSMLVDSFEEIRNLWKLQPKNFKVNKATVMIILGSDPNSKKLAESWENMLPPEINAKASAYRDKTEIVMNRKELEKRLGLKFSMFSRLFNK
ncbi:MAG: phospholipase D family protein [Peptoniphilaceae bacterium]|nr:phospholipase D family protein [Peptoniphilaceae bacterium]MDY6019081.1 phospholipase D family protein [Anaerococcus sp.]